MKRKRNEDGLNRSKLCAKLVFHGCRRCMCGLLPEADQSYPKRAPQCLCCVCCLCGAFVFLACCYHGTFENISLSTDVNFDNVLLSDLHLCWRLFTITRVGVSLRVYPELSCPLWPCNHRRGSLHRLAHAARH